MAKNKYYVVWQGIKPGIYSSWDACQKQINGFPQAKYAGFPDQESAKIAFSKSFEQYYKTRNEAPTANKSNPFRKPILNSWSVDAACSGNPGLMEYQGVLTDTKQVLFRQGPFPNGTNNIGEFLAIVHALALQKKLGVKLPIYSDSATAQAWIRQRRCNTKLVDLPGNDVIFDLIERAEIWLKDNVWEVPIIKWDTKSWGEIPADFGRK